MKDEAAGKPILEFIGLRPKMYSFLTAVDPADPENLKEKHTAKGISRAVKAQLRHEQYREQLEMPLENYQNNKRIGCKLHELYGFAVDKRGLCSYDDKRYFLNRIETLAYGHFRIPALHVAVDMHPAGSVDNGLIVLAHSDFVRTKLKRKHEKIVAAAPTACRAKAACAAPDAADSESTSAWDL